jgi:xanthine dehydrogenase accessory factor
MDRSGDYEVLKAALEWLGEGEPVFLVTVAKAWGASPRHPGSLMAIHPNGGFAGSVSGGCVEDDLVQRVMRGEFESGLPRLEAYGVDAEQAQRVGLPCGGSLTLLIERIDAPEQVQTLLSRMNNHQPVSRRVCLNTGESSLHPVKPDQELIFDEHNLIKTFGPCWRLLLVGAGELSHRLAQIVLTLDYAVTLCDPRPEYTLQRDNPWLAEGVRFVSSRPCQAVNELRPDPRTAVLALSHTPALDDETLLAALGSEAGYIGALGSQKNQQARQQRLLRHGISAAQLNRLHGPVGLAIGSRTPAEIAISIAADLIQARRLKRQEPPRTEHA